MSLEVEGLILLPPQKNPTLNSAQDTQYTDYVLPTLRPAGNVSFPPYFSHNFGVMVKIIYISSKLY